MQDSAARITIGSSSIPVPSLAGRPAAQAAADERGFRTQVASTLAAVGYPAKADPAKVDEPAVIGLLTVLMLLGAMTLGPISAALVEMFPTRIRYTAMSLPYHLGNGYFGGLLPAICFAIVIQTGDIYAGLWYPVVVAGASCILGALTIAETRKVDIFARD